MIEGVQVMKGLFADGPFNFTGEHYTITGHEGLPKPVQSPHPPIMIGAGGERMLRFAAREADIIGINPVKRSNEAWEDQNVADATAEATDRKIGWIRESAGARFDDLELSIVAPFLILTDDRVGLAASIAAGLDVPDGVDTGPDVVLVEPLRADRHGRRDRRHAHRAARPLAALVLRLQRRLASDTMAPIVERLAGR